LRRTKGYRGMSASELRRHPLRFIWRMDEDGRFTLDSEEFVSLVGSRTAAALGRPWQELAAELGLDPTGQIARALATRDTWSGLAVLWPRDAGPERLAVELSGLPVFDRDRTFRGYRGFGICRDIDDRAGAVPAQRLDAAPELAPAATAQNIVPFPTAAEPSAPELTPIERSAFHELSRKLTQWLSAANHRPSADASPSDPIETQPSAPVAAPADADEGAPAHAPAETVAPEFASAPIDLVALSAILDTASDGVILLDRRGFILSASRGADALFGYGAKELAGRPLSELLAPQNVEAVYDCLYSATNDGGARSHRHGRAAMGRTRQGEPLQLFMTMGRVDDGGDQLCVAVRDISEWKRAAEELTQAKRQAEQASAAKSDFLARVSHEIRTPLNAIIGFSELMMEERFGPVSNERYREYLKDIHTSGGHLLSLVNDLLDLSKIEAGKLELSFTSVSLNALTQQCVAIMQPQANRERIIIRTSLPPTVPQIVADARSVRQIVLNLLSNSIKFTGAGGQVIVSTALNDDGEVALRVRDTGIGMSEKDLAAALEPFRQLATSVNGAAGGTGLGLPLTKALAEANRARFHIKSAPQAGTLVEIAFPANRVMAG
jgi:PAS domain S-box-containing protein